MATKESNKEFVVDFLRKATSLKEADQDEALEKIRDLFMILGYERSVAEALPILAGLSAFYSNFRLLKLVTSVPLIDFELTKHPVVDGILTFFGEFLNSEEEELRVACLRKIAAVMSIAHDLRRFQNFLWGLHASDAEFRRSCIFDFLRLEQLHADFFANQAFFEDYFGRLVEEPSPANRRKTMKLLLELTAKFPALFSPRFFESLVRTISDDKTPSVAMFGVVCALKAGNEALVEEQFWKALRSKNPYLLKLLFDHLTEIKRLRPALFGDEFIDAVSSLFYEAEADIRNLGLDVLDTAVKVVTGETAIAKLLNNAKQSVATNATKDAKYNVMVALLRCADNLTKEQCVELILKHLLVFLREEQESFDVYFVQALGPFVRKCRYELLRESLDLFFRSMVIHVSQRVS